MNQQVEAFFFKATTDTEPERKVHTTPNREAVVALAKEAGFSFSVPDLAQYSQELGDDELQAVAGGLHTFMCRRGDKPSSKHAMEAVRSRNDNPGERASRLL